MSNYGRNFYFAQPPEGNERAGRYCLTSAADVLIGAPVLKAAAGSVENALGLTRMELAAEGSSIPKNGMGGICVFEHVWGAFNGTDPLLTLYSDLNTAPASAAIQVIHSAPNVKVGYRNTTTESFYGQRTYAGKTMIAGIGATPTLVVGDYLTPGDGTTAIWKKTTDPTKGWLVVTKIDGDVLEAYLNF